MGFIKRILLIFFCFSLHANAYAEEWVSPIDIEYMQKKPEVFEKYKKARDFIDASSGPADRFVEAEGLLKEILQQDPKFAPAYKEYGRLYIKRGHIRTVDDVAEFTMGSLGLSEQSILQAIMIEPDYADAYVLLGHLYTKMKLFDKAGQALEKAEAIGTQTPWLELNWADLLRLQDK